MRPQFNSRKYHTVNLAHNDPREEVRKMIARFWFGSTRSEDADVYRDYIEETGVAGQRAVPGNRGSLVLRRLRGERAEFVVVSLWKSEEAMHAFAGDEGERAVYYPDDDRYLVERRDRVDIYEIVGGFAEAVR